MTDVVCIVGLPGSGKTHLANTLLNTVTNSMVYDDIASIDCLPEDGEYTTIFLTDPHFCFDQVRKNAYEILTKKYKSIEWIFFENNIQKCIKNVEHRNDGRRVVDFIKNYSKFYKIPENATVLKIWQNTP